MPPVVRLFAAAACCGAWLALLFLGHAFGGAVHLLAVLAAILVPWRTPPGASGGSEED